MMKRPPRPSRITMTDTSEGLRIIIPGRPSWFVVGFLGLWLGGWGIAEVMVVLQLVKGDAPPEGEASMLVWFAIWTLGGILALYALLWQVIGKEILTVHGSTLTIRRDVGGVGFSKAYSLTQMDALQIKPVEFNPFDVSSSLQLWGIGGGVVAFDYGGKLYRFGAGLNEPEAKQIVAAMTQRYPVSKRSKA